VLPPYETMATTRAYSSDGWSIGVSVCCIFVTIALHDISLLKDDSIPPFVLPTPLTKQDRPLEYSYVMHAYMHTCTCTRVCMHTQTYMWTHTSMYIHELTFTTQHAHTLYMHSGVARSCDIQLTRFSLHRYQTRYKADVSDPDSHRIFHYIYFL